MNTTHPGKFLKPALGTGILAGLLGLSVPVIARFNLPVFTKLTSDFNLITWQQARFDEHPQFQRRLLPDYTARVRTVNVEFTFTTDSKGRRITPVASRPDAPAIGFFGASFTFGLNVNDHETFTWLAGEKLRDRYQLENYASLGWTTLENVQRLREVLRNHESPRLSRVYLDWLPSNAERLEPYLSGFTPAQRREKALDRVEQLFLEARDLCAASGVRFTALVLARKVKWNDPSGPYERALAFFARNGIEYLDLSDLTEFDRPTPFDTHPGLGWHREVAGRITAWLEGSPERPGRGN